MNKLIGKKVKNVRKMNRKEIQAEYWDSPAVCIEFEDGTIIFASMDEEGNGPGSLFGQSKDGSSFYLG